MNKLIKGNKKGEKKKETTTTSKKCFIESHTIWLLPKIVSTRDIFFYAQDIALFGDRHVAQQSWTPGTQLL